MKKFCSDILVFLILSLFFPISSMAFYGTGYAGLMPGGLGGGCQQHPAPGAYDDKDDEYDCAQSEKRIEKAIKKLERRLSRVRAKYKEMNAFIDDSFSQDGQYCVYRKLRGVGAYDIDNYHSLLLNGPGKKIDRLPAGASETGVGTKFQARLNFRHDSHHAQQDQECTEQCYEKEAPPPLCGYERNFCRNVQFHRTKGAMNYRKCNEVMDDYERVESQYRSLKDKLYELEDALDENSCYSSYGRKKKVVRKVTIRRGGGGFLNSLLGIGAAIGFGVYQQKQQKKMWNRISETNAKLGWPTTPRFGYPYGGGNTHIYGALMAGIGGGGFGCGGGIGNLGLMAMLMMNRGGGYGGGGFQMGAGLGFGAQFGYGGGYGAGGFGFPGTLGGGFHGLGYQTGFPGAGFGPGFGGGFRGPQFGGGFRPPGFGGFGSPSFTSGIRGVVPTQFGPAAVNGVARVTPLGGFAPPRFGGLGTGFNGGTFGGSPFARPLPGLGLGQSFGPPALPGLGSPFPR